MATGTDGGTDPIDADRAVRNAHDFFEHHSGWAPPDDDTLAEWAADGMCRAPDECLTTPDGWCEHDIASWALILSRPGPAPAPGYRRDP